MNFGKEIGNLNYQSMKKKLQSTKGDARSSYMRDGF